ncbi:fructose-1-phosphate/6-phosphogluconate phosphatase [Actinomadura vinacea]|uniref:Fructose-1-phosphate/6-phosphogluconate phosphatase n=1 Tax=Actinomadura vinacea TaxID=115336 RepID=A0ABN3JAX0_9ACTN
MSTTYCHPGESPLECDAYIFDFDGTLANIGDLNMRALRAGLAAFDVEVTLEWLQAEPILCIADVRRRLARDNRRQPDCADIDLYRSASAYWTAHVSELRPVETVVTVARRSSVPMAVASANDATLVQAGLAALGLADLFPVVLGRQHAPRLKPSPDVFLLAASRLRIEPDRCLVYENTDAGVSAARSAGMAVVDVRAWETPSKQSVQASPPRAGAPT